MATGSSSTAAFGLKAPEFSTKVSEACEAGEKFVEVFYETFDKRRKVSVPIELNLASYPGLPRLS